MAKPNRHAKLGQGGRFAALKQDLAQRGAKNPGALAAWIGMHKYHTHKLNQVGKKKHR